MKLTNFSERTIHVIVLSITLIAWIVLLYNPGNIMGVEHCHVSMAGPSVNSWEMLLAMNPLESLLLGWFLMVVAMMLPKLISAIVHICERSFTHKRVLHASVFVLCYCAVWMLAGVVSTFIILGLNLLWPMSYVPAALVGGIALVWQFSPWKQRMLNNGHDHPAIAAFGGKAILDVARFGILHGVWCVGAGWALMLFPMVLPEGHNVAMLLMTVLMISEHMENPEVPRWRFVARLKLVRIARYQLVFWWKSIYFKSMAK